MAGKRGAAFTGRRRLCFVLTGLLAACAAPEPPGTPSSAATAPSGPIAAPPPADSPPAASLVVAATPTAPLVAVAARLPGLARLEGLSGTDLAAALGPPDFRRRDLPAEIWQYRAAGCILDVFLYAEPGGFRVAHAEARPREGLRIPPETCLAAVADRRTIRSTGL